MGILDVPSYSRVQADARFFAENHAGPANLPKWKQKLNLSLLGQSPARLLCLGDSTTSGVSADSYTTTPGTTWQNTPNAYPWQLAKILAAQGIPADVALATPGSSGSVDSHWTFSAGASYSAPTVGLGGSEGVTLPSVNAQTVCTPGFAADTYKIYYYQSSGSGTFTAQATGGTLTTINCNATPAGIVTRTITAASASTSNTVTMICTVLGSGCVIVGIEYWNSANPNRVRIFPAGASGQPTSSFADATAYGSSATALALAPDLTVISLGLNDVRTGVATATTISRLTTLANNARLTGDALLMSAVPAGTGSAGPIDVTALNAALAAVGGAYIDLQARYGRTMFAQGLQTSDQIHPNAMGYGDIARVVAGALLR